MATMEMKQGGAATVRMDNGAVVPVPPGYIRMEIGPDGAPDEITYPGTERVLWFTGYQMPCVLDRDLADGESYTDDHGSTWTRYGDEMVVSDLETGTKPAA